MTLLSFEQEREICDAYQSGTPGYIIAPKFGVRPKRIMTVLRKHGIAVKTLSQAIRKHTCDDHFFDEIDTEEKAYFLGLLFADGCVSPEKNTVNLNLKMTDIDIIDSFRQALRATNPVKLHQKKGYTPAARLVIASQGLVEGLSKHGCGARKSASIRFPSIPEHLKWVFIRGYFDGDGCISINYTTRVGVATVTSNQLFLNDLSRIIKTQSINARVYPLPNPIYGALRISGNRQVRKFLSLLYSQNGIGLHRKKAKSLNFIEAAESPHLLTRQDIPARLLSSDVSLPR